MRSLLRDTQSRPRGGVQALSGRDTREGRDKGRRSEHDLLQVPNTEAGGSHLQATEEDERLVDWTRDLREIRRTVEFLVRRVRKLDVKADVAV